MSTTIRRASNAAPAAAANVWMANRRDSAAATQIQDVKSTSSAPSSRRTTPPPQVKAVSEADSNLPGHIAAGRVILPQVGAPQRQAQLGVLDPLIRGGKVMVPLEKTLDTKGRADWLAGKFRRDLSVCCLFHKGRCHAAERCHQVHVDRDTLEHIRAANANIVCCCQAHNDAACQSDEATAFFTANQRIQHVAITDEDAPSTVVAIFPLSNVSFTSGTPELFASVPAAQDVASFTTARVCRLHLKGCCKYGKDCRHLHLCTKLAAKFGVAPVEMALEVMPTASTAVAAVAKPPKPSVSPASVAAQPPATSSTPVAAPSAVSPKPLFAPSFLRANYPVLDQGSLRASMPMGGSVNDDLELTFRPFERLPLDLSPTYITAQRLQDESSPVSSCGQSSTRTTKRQVSAATIESPAAFFGQHHAMSP